MDHPGEIKCCLKTDLIFTQPAYKIITYAFAL